jgi:hypothetical protein
MVRLDRLTINGVACALGRSTMRRTIQSVMPNPAMAGTIVVPATSKP